MTKPIEFNPKQNLGVSSRTRQATLEGKTFAEMLTQTQPLTFSKHAQNRIENRQIQLNDDGLARLSEAVEKAEKRGGQESLILMDDMAFIVNIKNRMVITAMDATKRGEGVFTQIDSVVLAGVAKQNPFSDTADGKK